MLFNMYRCYFKNWGADGWMDCVAQIFNSSFFIIIIILIFIPIYEGKILFQLIFCFGSPTKQLVV